MKRSLVVLCAVAASFSCSAPPKPPSDAGLGPDPEELEITVSGTASVHPAAAQYLQAQGKPVPTVAGLTLRVEEPLRVALSDPTGVFGTLTLPQSGAFSVAAVPVRLVNLGIAGGVRDDSDAGVCGVDAGIADGGCGLAPRRVIRTATTLWDVALEDKKPEGDLSGGKAHALPAEFHDKLTEAVGAQTIAGLAAGRSTLISAGFILGRLVDAAGAPVQGARIVTAPSSLSAQVFYPKADLSGTQASTSSTGLFVFVHNGGEVVTFKYTVEGKPEYLTRNGGAAKDACLLSTVYPGRTAP